MSDMASADAMIEGLGRWKHVALAALCAETMLPVITRFAQSVTTAAFKDGLDVAWNSAVAGRSNPRTSNAQQVVSRLPESNCDDSHVPAFDVMAALGALAYALDAITAGDSGLCARYSCSAAASCYSGYDHALEFGNQARKIDPRNPPPPGRLQSLQLRMQRHSIEKMRIAERLSHNSVEELRESANRVASELDRALPTYTEIRWGSPHD